MGVFAGLAADHCGWCRRPDEAVEGVEQFKHDVDDEADQTR